MGWVNQEFEKLGVSKQNSSIFLETTSLLSSDIVPSKCSDAKKINKIYNFLTLESSSALYSYCEYSVQLGQAASFNFTWLGLVGVSFLQLYYFLRLNDLTIINSA